MFTEKNDTQISSYPNIIQSFGICGIIILVMTLLVPVNLLLDEKIGKEASSLICYLLGNGISLAIVYSVRKRKTNVASFNFTLKNKRIIPYLIICSIAFLYGIISPIGNSIPMPESVKRMILDTAANRGFSTFVMSVIAAPIMEELFMRGIILDGLLKKYSPFISILISSFLFGLIHLNPWQFVGALLIGIFSGWVYYKSQSLLPSIIIHATLNLNAFFMRFILDPDSVMEKSLVEMYGGLQNLILIIAGSILVFSICIYYLRLEFIKSAVSMNGDILNDPIGNEIH